jgi:hypothetical protein
MSYSMAIQAGQGGGLKHGACLYFLHTCVFSIYTTVSYNVCITYCMVKIFLTLIFAERADHITDSQPLFFMLHVLFGQRWRIEMGHSTAIQAGYCREGG